MATQTYDVIVIGGGPAGENVAARAVRGGLDAVLIESELVGGECSYWACMPSKALLRPGQALATARAVDGARQAVTGQLDAAAVLARRDAFASHWRDTGQVRWLEETRIAFLRGHGRLAGARRVTVRTGDGADLELTARHAVVIATGSRAALPPVPGLAEVRPWTSREATSAKAAPRRLAILGGGVVACEMASAWKDLGTDAITIVQRGPRLVPGTEPFAGEMLAEAFARRGVRVHLNGEAAHAARAADGTVTLTLADGTRIDADELLVAAGRAPRTDDLGLESVGLAAGSWLPVDASQRVPSVAGGWLYAVGDVNRRALLTHMGKYQARICGDAIAARAAGRLGDAVPPPWSAYADTADDRTVPQVIFTDPEIGAVGLSEEQARRSGLRIRVIDYDVGLVAGARLYADGYTGRARMVVDEDRRVVVGLTLVGPGAGEMIHAATIAVAGEVPLERLWHAVPSYPTISELLAPLAGDVRSLMVHAPVMRSLMDRGLAGLALLAVVLAAPAAVRADAVTAVVTGGSLIVTGNAGDDSIAIAAVDADSLQVTPNAPTTLNGGPDPITFDGVTKDLVLLLGIGANQTTIAGITIPGLVIAKGGSGSDVLTLVTSTVGGMKLDLGAGLAAVTVAQSALTGKLTYKGGADQDTLVLDQTIVTGSASVASGAGDNVLVLSQSNVGGTLVYKGGAGIDALTFTQSTLPAGKLKIGAGAGTNVLNVSILAVDGSISYAGGADDDTVILDALTTPAGVTVKTGAGTNTLVTSSNLTIGDDLAYKGGADEDTVVVNIATLPGNFVATLGAGLNIFSISNLTIAGKLTVKAGKGDDGVVMTGSTIAGPSVLDLGDGLNACSLIGGSSFANLTVKSKSGVDTFDLVASTVNGNAVLALGAGNNDLGFDAGTVVGNLLVKTGGGDDLIEFANGSAVQGTETLDLGGGTNTTVHN